MLATKTLNASQLSCLDRLWRAIFDATDSGLVPPRQLSADMQLRNKTRSAEMAAILASEKDIQDVHQGKKELDAKGNFVELAQVPDVKTHPIIEQDADRFDFDDSTELLNVAKLIDSTTQSQELDALEQSFNLRKIAIHAEDEIYSRPVKNVGSESIEVNWLKRWKLFASQCYSSGLQMLWAKILVNEITFPDSQAYDLLELLANLREKDLPILSIAAKISFGDFIFDLRSGYLKSQIYAPVFERLCELKLILSEQGEPRASQRHLRILEKTPKDLNCSGRVLRISSDSNKALNFPVIDITPLGKQMIQLCDVEPDLAYLFGVAKQIVKRGCSVSIGELIDNDVGKPQFLCRIAL